MPRPVRDFDEEIDVIKPGRKTRAVVDAVSGVDSPLRRSTRNKTSVVQYGSSPDSPLSDASNVSSTQTKRVTRRRTIAMDSIAPTETHRTLRSRMNSMSSDVSEIVELDITTPTKKTRSSGINDAATKTNNRKSKRLVRAGSEAGSPPPARVTRATRATSVGSDISLGSKVADRYNSELTGTPLRMKRRTSVLPMEATVPEEKDECMKIAIVSLNRTLPDVKELKETGSAYSPKSVEKNESLSALEDKHNTTPKSRNEKNAEDENSVRTPQNNSPEKGPSVNSEELDAHALVHDEEILKNNKNASEDDEKLSIHVKKAVELSVQDECQILSESEHEGMSKKLGLKHEDLLNKSIGRNEDNSNKENVAANVNDSETVDDVVLQSLKPIIAGSPNSEINLTPKRHSRELSKMANNKTPVQEVTSNKDVDNILTIEIMDISDNEEDNSSKMEKLVVSMEAESVPEISTSERSDKNISLEAHTKSNSEDSIELIDCTDVEVNDDSSTQMNILMDEEPEETHDKKNNEDEDLKSDISLIEKDMDKNVKSERYNISTGDKRDMIGEHIESCEAGNIDEKHDEMSGIETCSSANLSNAESPKSSDATLVTDSQQSVLEHTRSLQNGDLIKNVHSNTCIISESSDAHLCLKDSADSNTNQQDNVTDVIKSSQSSIVTDTFGESIEEARELEEHTEKVSALDNSLTLNKQPIDEIGSNEKDLNVNEGRSKENEKSVEINDNDSDSNAEDLFQDIPASEWEEKSINAADKNSVHSVSTERLENESEAGSDLVLVDREAWLAAENMKVEKEKETFDYDSDDTVLLKTKRDSLQSQNEKSAASYVMESECMLDESKNKTSVSKKRKSMEPKEAKHKEDEMVDMGDTQDTENPVNVDGDKSVVKSSKTHATPKHNSSLRDKNLCELHEEAEMKENVSLNKCKLSEDSSKKRKSLSKSMEESNKFDECNETQAIKKEKSLNKSNSEEIEKSETESSNGNAAFSSAKKSDKNQSLNSSLKKKMKPRRLTIVSTDDSDNDLKENNQEWKESSTKKKLTKNYSTSVNIGSDSNESKNISDSDDSRNRTVKLPKFLFGGSSDSNSEDNDGSNKSIDSDIEREYNLHGKSISKFSDDDVPGDECRASETESSDPDDNGSDLADFVVDDDEVEDEEDDESEQEDGEGIEKQEMDAEENAEDKRTETEVQDEDRKMEIEEEMQVDEVAGEEKESEDNKENIVEKSISKAIDTSVKQKHKSRKSGDLSLSEITRSDKKKKKQQKNTSQTRSDEMETSLADISLSVFETKKAKQKRASGEFTVEDVEQPLNESEFMFNKKLQKLNKSMECSTPKVHPSKREKCNVSMQMLHTSLEGIRKKQGTKSSEVKEDMISDKEESKNMTLNEGNISKKLNKTKANETLMHRSLPSELIEVVTKTNLSRPMSSRVVELNKTTFIPESESPTTKYLKKEKLNESAPVLKLHAKFKKLDDIGDSNEQRNQLEDQNEGLNERNIEVTKDANESVKTKILKVADSLLENDQQKKRKKRKQSTVVIHDYVRSQSQKIYFDDINDSIKAGEIENIVPTMSTDNKVEAVAADKKKKKKRKTHNTAIPMMEEPCGEVAETELVTNDKNVCNTEKKKKKKKEKVAAAVLDSTNSDQELKIVKKKKKKVSDALPNENVSDEQLSKKKLKKRKLISEDIVSQDGDISREKMSKKKKKLSSEDTTMQYENVSDKEVSKKKKKLSKDILHNENIPVETLPTKKQKLHEGSKKRIVKCDVSNKLRESTNASSKADGKSKAFSKTPEETLKVLKHNNDSIKATKELKKKKRMYQIEGTRKENEIKIKKSEAKNQTTKTNKTELHGESIKRLPDEVLENLSDIPAKPLKRRKISKPDDQILSLGPTFSLKSKEVRTMHIEDDFTSPSVSGSTTEFSVINLRKMKKMQKRAQMHSFKQRMLGKRKREPVSAYLMYLEKQKVSGKDKLCNRPY